MPSPPRCAPAPARSSPNAIALDAQRILMLERFHRRVPAVGHVRVRRAVPVAARRRAHAAGDGFVIGERRAAHRSRRRSSDCSWCRELAAGMRSGAAFASAPSTTSVMRCDVSTFPAAIAAGALRVHHGALRRDHANRPQDARGVTECLPAPGSGTHTSWPQAPPHSSRSPDPATCALDPVKSTVARIAVEWSPRPRIHTGRSRDAVVIETIFEAIRRRGGSLRMAARIMRSL